MSRRDLMFLLLGSLSGSLGVTIYQQARAEDAAKPTIAINVDSLAQLIEQDSIANAAKTRAWKRELDSLGELWVCGAANAHCTDASFKARLDEMERRREDHVYNYRRIVSP